MRVSDMLNMGIRQLNDAGIENAKGEAEQLYCFMKKIGRTEFFVRWSKEANDKEIEGFFQLIQERATRKPLQHILGKVEFMGLPIIVRENVLIPRMDTEVVVEEAINIMPKKASVLDLCCGSGIIGISIAKLTPAEKKLKKVTSCDKSKDAIALTVENAKLNDVKLEIKESDLFSAIKKKFDLIISNPPYVRRGEIPTLDIEVREFDPIDALDGGEDGLDFYRKIVDEAVSYLKKDGWLVFEVGYDQGKDVAEIFKADGRYANVEISKDLADDDRVVKAQLV
ncbi:MAG: peptide chain release factor N(5)-glutamine methyltransferase [Eubacteriales bacterium]|nr:peptide chain release factor N(5)-glutamine methyltransferase [Eubacteriales bacterium]MDY3332284.1 peptide chain release factor N(5)-glutamine methyltransferase [Gallibacter sp.]